MSDTTSYINSNYEVAIPPSVRKELGLSPGQKVDFIKLHVESHFINILKVLDRIESR